MSVAVDRSARGIAYPLRAGLLVAATTLFLAALLADLAYSQSVQVQWTNFASWLIAGALVPGAIALLLSVVGVSRAPRRRGRPLLVMLVVLATCVLGFVNALVHARDAFATMPWALLLSAVVTVLACVATGLASTSGRIGDRA